MKKCKHDVPSFTASMISPQIVDCALGAPAVVDGSCRAILCGTERARPVAARLNPRKVCNNIFETQRPTNY